MESTLPHAISPSELAPGDATDTTPFAQQTVVLTKQAYIELKWQANYWRAQYEQMVEREAALKADIDAYQATIRDLTQRLYGTKSEKATRLDKASEPTSSSPRKRGEGVSEMWIDDLACAAEMSIISCLSDEAWGRAPSHEINTCETPSNSLPPMRMVPAVVPSVCPPWTAGL